MNQKQEALRLGLSEREYDEIVKALKREPNKLEVWLYSAMWSEHCSYKNSKRVLRQFPTSGPQVLQGPGENAGIVDIGDNLAIAMKVESHNHPSAIDPYNGAATGVGGILRDIFTMGARPIAILNSLRFGKLENDRVKFLLEKAVEGMADYGKGMELPTVGGEVYFDNSYRENPLVNAMAAGLISHDEIVRAVAAGVGNSVILVGQATGREGIHGASFASEELDEEDSKVEEMQVGDPHLEKRLMEACLEMMRYPWLIGIQDLGAAGIISSSCEMAAKAGSGIEIDVSQVHCKEELKSYEIMLSETQERMLLIVEKGKEQEVYKICKKWDLEASKIGTVTDDGLIRIIEKGEIVGEVPAKSLAEDVPEVVRESRKPRYFDDLIENIETKEPEDLNDVLKRLLQSSNIASREWLYGKFDNQNHKNVLVGPGSDAAVVKIPGTDKAIALTCDCNGYICYLDPFEGGKYAVAEAARNLVASGAKPLALTDGLNFGSPENPEIYYQLEQCADGISEAAKALDTPVISGNVSLYNESRGVAIYPTPVIGMLGVIEDAEKSCTMAFKNEGDVVVLLGENSDEVGGSVYLREIQRIHNVKPPKLDLEKEKNVQELCLTAIKKGLINSAHDISEGGLAIAVAESCITGNKGFIGKLDTSLKVDGVLFGESPSRFVVSLPKENFKELEQLAQEYDVNMVKLGEVASDEFKFVVKNADKVIGSIEMPLEEIADVWKNSIKRKLGKCGTN